MSWFSKTRTYPIGVDMGDDVLRIAQLGRNGEDISLIAGKSRNRPEDIKLGSGSWQRWVIETIREFMADGGFKGKDVVAAMPASEVFIDHVRMEALLPGTSKTKRGVGKSCDKLRDEGPMTKVKGELHDIIFSQIKQKLPFDSPQAMIRYIPTEEDNILVMITDLKKIDGHLAIYEKANLHIKSLGVWPVALTNSYVKLFAKRQADIKAVVMLLDIETNCTNVVICRHKNLLFARSIPVGAKQLDDEEAVKRLVLELTACRRWFNSVYEKAHVERLIFVSGEIVGVEVCTAVAKQLELPAQMADCLTAVEVGRSHLLSVDRRQCQFSWAAAFGLSLSWDD